MPLAPAFAFLFGSFQAPLRPTASLATVLTPELLLPGGHHRERVHGRSYREDPLHSLGAMPLLLLLLHESRGACSQLDPMAPSDTLVHTHRSSASRQSESQVHAHCSSSGRTPRRYVPGEGRREGEREVEEEHMARPPTHMH